MLVRAERRSCAGLHFTLVAKTDGVCELSRPLRLLRVCRYTCVCVKENVQLTLCAQTRPAGGPLLRQDAKSFLVSNLASATLRSLALPSSIHLFIPAASSAHEPAASSTLLLLLLSASREEENTPVVYLALHLTCTAQ